MSLTPESLAERRALEKSVNQSKEAALSAYDEALRVAGDPEAGSYLGDKLTEIAYSASHRLDEAGNSIQDSVNKSVKSINQSIEVMKSNSGNASDLKELGANAKNDQSISSPTMAADRTQI